MQPRWIVIALMFAGLVAHSSAQLRQAGPKITGWGETSGGEFGLSSSISADGNTAIVGGPTDNGQLGAAWIFVRRGSVWSQQGLKLVGTGAVGQSAQGYSVSISADGNTAIVGGNLDNTRVGAAWIFTRSGEVWTQQGGKLVGTGGVGTPFQGQSVSMSPDGNTAIVGGWGDNGNTGAAWVFVRNVPQWTQQGSKLVGTGAVGTSEQGWSVSLSSNGNTAVVGGWNDNASTGAAWIFIRSGSVWTQQGSKLVGTGAVGAAIQGVSASISADGSTVIMGGNQDNSNIGAAWVFARSGTVWTQQGPKLVGTGGVGMVNQGYSVALSGDGSAAMVGGPSDNSSMGAAWIFARSGSTWTQQGSKIAGTGGVGATDQGFGVSLSSDANTAIISGYGDNTSMGAAWIYMNAPPTLKPVRDLPSDQGGTVVVNWDKSPLDSQVLTVVTEYWVWRGIRSPSASPRSVVLNWKEYCSAVATHTLTPQTFLQTREGDSPLAGDIYWQYMLSLPSLGLDHYSYACPTLADSTSQGIPWRYFFITARTNDPNAYWNSQPDSGYSVDNLPPGTPLSAGIRAVDASTVRLSWRPPGDPDLGQFVVYRSTTGGFTPSDSTRFASLSDTVLTDLSAGSNISYFYRITARDIHGNESTPSLELARTSMPMLSGWNLVSVPLTVSDYTATTLYPGAASQAFWFQGSYVPQSVLANGWGYWVFYTSGQMVEQAGARLLSETIPVVTGWNMIGGVASPVATSSIVQSPPGIVSSSYYGFTGSYVNVTTLEPGNGYWVYVTAPGTLGLTSSTSPLAKDEPTLLDSLNRVLITDAAGHRQELYFGVGAQERAFSYQLPPRGPEGTADVRFANNGMVAMADTQTTVGIEMNAVHYPVQIRWTMKSPEPGALVIHGQETALHGEGVLSMASESSLALSLGTAHGTSGKPTTFTLEQNYPNPFNPSTMVRYDLPQATHVTLEVYNMLGQRISTLVDGMEPPGTYRVEWNAAGVASGMYLCRIQAGSFMAVRKMAVVK